MSEAVTLVGMIAAVCLPKLVPVLLMPERIPGALRRWLTYIAPAVLSALIAPSIVAPNGTPSLDWRLPAYAVAFGMAVRTRGMLRSLAAGVAVVLLLEVVRRTGA